MKILAEESKTPLARQTAADMLDVIPRVMCFLRTEVMACQDNPLSMPEFRALHYLQEHSGISLSDLAEHMAIALPSMSKHIDHLVDRGMARRQTDPADRRRVALALTAQGATLLKTTSEHAHQRLAEALGPLKPSEHAQLRQAMELLQHLFKADAPK